MKHSTWNECTCGEWRDGYCVLCGMHYTDQWGDILTSRPTAAPELDARIKELEEENRGYEKRERAYIAQIEATTAPEPQAHIWGNAPDDTHFAECSGCKETRLWSEVRYGDNICPYYTAKKATAAPGPSFEEWYKNRYPAIYHDLRHIYLQETKAMRNAGGGE